MALTPVEIRHMTPSRGLFGYKTDATDRLLADVTASFEDVWRERADLADRVEQLEADLVRYRELESLLRTTLVSAERASVEMKEQARREAELILSEAHAEARRVQRGALAENERLVGESRRLRAQLSTALATLEDETDDLASRPEPEVAADAPEGSAPEPTWHDFGSLPVPDADAA
jgi:cell division initiation protein